MEEKRKTLGGKIKNSYGNLFKDWFTIVLIPQKASRVIRLKIPQPVFLGGVGLFVLVFLGGVYAIVNNLYLSGQMGDFQKVQRDNLQNQISLRKVSNQMEALSEQFDRMRELDYKLRILTDLNVERPSPSAYGIGGSLEPSEVSTLERMDLSKMDLLTLLEKDLSRMKEMANYQEESFNNLKDFLSDRKDLLERTPHRWPVKGFLSSTFGYRLDPITGLQKKHEGLDIVAKRGTVITAPADGIVTYTGEDPTLGHMVVIDHGYGVITRYGHNESLLVREGKRVKRGTPIATLGSSGKSTGPHLHYEIRIKDIAVNPINYMME
ncbi:MAG: M23 family metallopeptidase [Deltaproteobacteria bacterium]|nr:M23 family metallopeptidase [Deltaproteobacteria bacterium]